jgi:hypothetical protein
MFDCIGFRERFTKREFSVAARLINIRTKSWNSGPAKGGDTVETEDFSVAGRELELSPQLLGVQSFA